LRAQARAKILTDEQDLEKAMALIERSHLLEPSLAKLELRAELADRLQDGSRVVNSLWQINNWPVSGNRNSKNFSEDDRKALQTKLESYEDMLARISDPALSDRIAFVGAMLTQSQSNISVIQAMGSSSIR
jgi:CTP synthase (UTP-ammonia lyase)